MKTFSKFHSALSDPIRMRILRLLIERELCVCEIVQVLKVPQYKVSRHLGILKKAGLVRDWREGTWAHYEISPLAGAALRKVLVALSALWDQSPVFQADVERLRHPTVRKPGQLAAGCA